MPVSLRHSGRSSLNIPGHSHAMHSPAGAPVPGHTPARQNDMITQTGHTPFFGKFEVLRYRLKNGLDVILMPDSTVPVVACQTWFRVGSRDEVPGITGMAHLLEHLMFKETTSLPEGAFSRILEEAGARDFNAWTWCDETVYTQSVPKQYLELVLRLESDRMANLNLHEQQLASEREVVLNERRFTTEDDPFGRMYEVMCLTAFDRHSYRWPVIGKREDVENVSLDEVRDFYRRFYSPNNAMLILAGDLNVEETMALVGRYYGDLEPHEISRADIVQEPERRESRRVELSLQIESDVLQLGFIVPGLSHADRPALTMLDLLLMQGRGCRLQRRLVNSGIASSIDGALLPFKDPYLYEIQVTLREGHSLEEAEAAVFDEVQRLITDGIEADELQRARQKFQVDAYHELRDSNNRANFVGLYELAGDGFEAGLARIQETLQVTAEQIQSVAMRYLHRDNVTILMARPTAHGAEESQSENENAGQDASEANGSAEASSGEGSAQADSNSSAAMEDAGDRSAMAEDGEAEDVESDDGEAEDDEESQELMGLEDIAEALSIDLSIPEVPDIPWKVSQYPLPHEGQLFVVQEHNLPLASLQIIIPGGMSLERPEQEGLANFLGEILLRGTRTHSRESFEDALEALGATLDVIADVDHLTVVGSTLSSNFEALVELLKEALTEPLLSEKEFQRLKGEILANIRDSRNDDKSLADFWFLRTLMGDHPYGRSSLGVPQSIESLELGDIEWAHTHMIHSRGWVAGVAGDVSVERAQAAIEGLMPVLPSGQSIPEKSALLPGLPAYDKAGSLLMVDKPERSQVQLLIGMRGINHSHPDYPLLTLGNIAFGGPMSSTRLMNEVREKRGWSYGVSSRFDCSRMGGYFQLWVFPSGGDLGPCMELILGMLEDLAVNGITEEELAFGKRVILNGAAFDDDTPERSMRDLINRQWQGTQRKVNLERVANATLAEVNRALRDALKLDELMAVMVCEAKEVSATVSSMGVFSSISTVGYDVL